MRILQVSTHINIGGIGNYILSLSSALKRKGIVVIVASSGGDLEGELANRDIRHKHIDIKTKNEFSPKVLKSIFRLRSIIKDEEIDIIHAHTRVSQVACLFASRLTGVPYITTCHGFFKKRLRAIFDTWGDKVIAISDAVEDHLKKDLGVKKERIGLIYNGVEIDRFKKEYSADEIKDIKRSIGLKDGPVIGNIGRLSPVKGQEFLIRAMADIVSKKIDAELVMVGDGPEERALKDLARSFKIEGAVHFISSSLDTPKYLSVMDAFVFPSLKEGLGIALLEALAAGKACVASAVGGIGDVIKNGFNGMLVPVGDPKAISDAVLSLLENPYLGKEMGERGRALVAGKFSLDAMADKVIGLYGEVLSGRVKGHPSASLGTRGSRGKDI